MSEPGLSFSARALSFLRETFPMETAEEEDAALLRRLEGGWARARGWGLSAEADLMGFVDLEFRLGPGFDRSPETPWAAEILGDAGMSPALRLATLRNAALMHLALELLPTHDA